MAANRRRKPAATRKVDARRAELVLERDRTQRRIQQLEADNAQLERMRQLNNQAIQQLVGRLRFVQEQLGEAAPMDFPPEPESEPDPVETVE